VFERREFGDHQSVRLPRAREDLDPPTAGEKAATGRGDARRSLVAIIRVSCDVLDSISTTT